MLALILWPIIPIGAAMSSESRKSKESQITESLQSELDQHGYSFQYAVIKEVQRIFPNKHWFVEVAEFPVMAGGHATHIDFVLSSEDRSFLLTAECKRVNPAYSDWWFVKAPFVGLGMNDIKRALITEKVTTRYVEGSSPGELRTEVLACGDRMDSAWFLDPDNVYNIGIPTKLRNETGDMNSPHGADRDAIEKAAGQACKGVSGLINRAAGRLKQKRDDLIVHTWYMPIIFTTANLYTSNINLSTSDLATGKVKFDSKDEVTKRNFVYLQYPMSPGLKHDFVKHSASPRLDTILEEEYLRTIAIVSASGIESFLTDFHKSCESWRDRRRRGH